VMLMDVELRYITQLIGNWTSIFVVPLMAIIIAIRLFREYKQTKQINYVRLLILCIFIAFTWAIIPTNMAEVPPFNTFISGEIIGLTEEKINPYSISIGLMVSFALSLIAYANKWEILYYTALSFYPTILASAILNNMDPAFDIFNMYYIYTAAVIGIVFFYVTGFRLRDNGSLGLGILFSIAFGALAFGENVIGDIFTISIAIFGLIFSLGFFTPFKTKQIEG